MTSPRYCERPRFTTAEALGARTAVPDGTGTRADRWRRTTPANDHDGMDLTEVLVAEFSNPDLYRLAALVPDRAVTSPGCRRDYPHWALMAFGHLASAYRSHRKVHMALRVPENWRLVLQTVERTAGPEAVAALRPKARLAGPTRNHWNYWLSRHARLWPELEHAYTPMAVAQAVEQGLLDPNTLVSHASPAQRNTIYGDGKVMSSPVRHRPRPKDGKASRRRDERPRRVDPASAFWQEGGDDGTDAHGTKFVFTSVRGPGHLNRVCLTMGHQRKRTRRGRHRRRAGRQDRRARRPRRPRGSLGRRAVAHAH